MAIYCRNRTRAGEFAAASLPSGLSAGFHVRPDGCVQRERSARPPAVADRDLRSLQLDVIANLQTTPVQDKANVGIPIGGEGGAGQGRRRPGCGGFRRPRTPRLQRQTASDAFVAGKAQLAILNAQLDQQQNDYELALSKVSDLQNQRAMYNQWLAEKKAEEERPAARGDSQRRRQRLPPRRRRRGGGGEAAALAAAEARAAAAERARLQAEAKAAAEGGAPLAITQARRRTRPRLRMRRAWPRSGSMTSRRGQYAGQR